MVWIPKSSTSSAIGCVSRVSVSYTTVKDDIGDPEAIREDFEKNVLGSQRWIVFLWRHTTKVLVSRTVERNQQATCERGAGASSIILCAGPPAPKEVGSAMRLIGIQLPHLKIVDCQKGIEVDRLYPYLQDLMKAQAEPVTK